MFPTDGFYVLSDVRALADKGRFHKTMMAEPLSCYYCKAHTSPPDTPWSSRWTSCLPVRRQAHSNSSFTTCIPPLIVIPAYHANVFCHPNAASALPELEHSSGLDRPESSHAVADSSATAKLANSPNTRRLDPPPGPGVATSIGFSSPFWLGHAGTHGNPPLH